MDNPVTVIDQLEKYNHKILYSLNTVDLQKERRVCIENINQQCKLLYIDINNDEKEQFIALAQKYVKIQEHYKNTSNEFHRIHLLVKDPNLSELQVQEIIDDGGMYQYVSDRHKDILKLERSIQEVHELFVATYAVVLQQGTQLNNAAQNISNAKENIQEAEIDLIDAHKVKKRKLFKSCIYF